MASEGVPPVLRRAAVLGAGTMGRAIAAHLANAGIEVLLLDLPDTESDDRDRLAREAIAALGRERPAPLYRPSLARRIRPGNLEDQLPELDSVDWVLEAVVERLDIKRALLEKVAAVVSDRCIVSTNTSGIPIGVLAESLPPTLRPRFLGTHFFNPPRYLHLLELIAGPATDPGVVDAMARFASERLGKGVVYAKDRPNFVANRIGVYGILRTVALMQQHGLAVSQVDALTGPLVGRPRSATFRTTDLVGLDVMLHVAGNVRDGAADDPEIEVFTPPALLEEMARRQLLGDKTGGGFYRKVVDEQGKRIEELDLATFEYRPKTKARFPEIEMVRQKDELKDRLRELFAAKGDGAAFAWEVLRDTLRYAASVAAEIADDLAAVDRAMRWGFGWELGPFETWDLLGMRAVAERMEAEERPAPEWVRRQLEAGAERFYPNDDHTLSLTGQGTTALAPRPGILQLRERADGPRRLERNAGATLWDLGDGVLGLEFHSKMNSLGGDAIQMSARAVATAEAGYEGLVVGNQGAHFSVGANLAMLLLAALEGEWEDIDLVVRQFQGMTVGLQRCARPVVVAPFSLTLGGGTEVTLHGDEVCASAELYMGMVEAGVGLIPAGGGTKEFYLRTLERLGPDPDPLQAARTVFETIGLAKVSTSAMEARELGFLRHGDRILLNPEAVLAGAKARVLALARAGYQAPLPREAIPVGGAETLALLEVGLYNMAEGRYISDHDRRIGRSLATILSGGATMRGASPRTVSEQQMLDLEREAFLSLCGERKTLERIQHMLKTGKPLRN